MWQVKFTEFGLDGEQWDSVVGEWNTEAEAEQDAADWNQRSPNEFYFVEEVQ